MRWCHRKFAGSALAACGLLAVLALLSCEEHLPSVTGLVIDLTHTSGDSVTLAWDPVTGVEIDGYRVYFKPNAVGSWQEVASVVAEFYTHHATCAGRYSVKAYSGPDLSEEYATPVTTMPNIPSALYCICDQYLPPSHPDYTGFIFGPTSGTEGFAEDSLFEQDMYCWDFSVRRGDYDAGLSSGSYGAWGNGEDMCFLHAEGVYGLCPDLGSSSWWEWGQLSQTDDVVFGALHHGHFVKIRIDEISAWGMSTDGTCILFDYEYQPISGLRLFTEASTPDKH